MPAVLLVVEYLVLSFRVDFVLDGPALALVNAVRLVVPIVIGAAAASWMLARGGAAEAHPPPPPGSRTLLLALQLASFAGTYWLAVRLLGDDAPPLTLGGTIGFLAVAATATLLAVSLAVPPSWIFRVAYERWRAPLLALSIGLATWRVASVVEKWWSFLSDSTLRASAALLRLVATDVRVDPSLDLLGVNGFEVVVAPICSGADGIGLVVTFLAVWIAVARDRLRFPRALVLLPIGALLAWAANVVRIAALVLTGAAGYDGLAFGGLHSKLGWILFTGLALGGVVVTEHLRWFQRPSDGTRRVTSGAPDAAAPYLAPLLAALATALVTSIWSTGVLDPWYGARAAAALVALFLVRASLPRPRASWSWIAVLLGLAVGICWVLLVTRATSTGAPSGLGEALAGLSPAGRAAWVAVRLLSAVIVIPLVEELAFRGFLLPWLVSPDFEKVPPRAWTWSAVLLSSLAFGALHEHWVLGTVAGVAFAVARNRRGRLSDAILAHATANAVVAVAALSGRWSLWG